MLKKALSVILVIAIIGTIVAISYYLVIQKTPQKFTEFYILGLNGMADDYPSHLTMNGGQVSEITYGDTTFETTNGDGLVNLGIVNEEQQSTVYTVEMFINNEPDNIDFGGTIVNEFGPNRVATRWTMGKYDWFYPETSW